MKKKMASFGGGKNAIVSRAMWEGLNHEILALILVRIPVEELLQTIPLVCKSWWSAVVGPYCWSEINVEEWCRRWNRFDRVDSLVRKLVRRSRGMCRRLSAYRLGDPGFAFAANWVRCLKVLQIPMSEVSDKIVEKHAESLATLTVLDISYCLRITKKGLEAVGKSCKFLIQLKRNMPPLELEETEKRAKKMDNGEAMAIANTMPGLNRLELAYGRFGDHGLNAILTNCKALSRLDIEGCLYVELNGDLEQRCNQLMDFKAPWTDDDHLLAVAVAADDDTKESSPSESE